MLFIIKISLFIVLFVGRGIYDFDIVTACRCPFEVATSAVLQMN